MTQEKLRHFIAKVNLSFQRANWSKFQNEPAPKAKEDFLIDFAKYHLTDVIKEIDTNLDNYFEKQQKVYRSYEIQLNYLEANLPLNVHEELRNIALKKIARLRSYLSEKKEIHSGKTELPKIENVPNSLSEIFKDQGNYQRSIDILKNVSPPLLNRNEEWIGKPKGTVCLWIEILRIEGLIKHLPEDIYADLVRKQFQITLDSSNFRKTHKRAEDKYRWNLEDLISKLSQKSQFSQ